MKAIIRTKAGKEFSTMKVQNIDCDKLQSNELKIKMISSRINPVDMDLMKGLPFLKYKKIQIGGVDGAGEVLEVGKSVTDFKIGDKVIFYRMFNDIGTWAENITIPSNYCAKIPSNINTFDAGAIVLPVLTAYESLINLDVKKNEKILIHGIGGGVGFQALLIAKQLGLYVIGTGSKNDKETLEKAGLNKFIDYKTQDFSKEIKIKEVDYIFDTIGGEILIKSINLKPKKVVSIKYVEINQMYKTGVILPNIIKFLIGLSMKKFSKLANKNNLHLMGQITGANGELLQKAINLIKDTFNSNNNKFLTFSEIEKNGLSKNSIGKIIKFI